ncbi:MAG: hypothetical protein LBO82_06735 [Synergistaceae bacterium]|nr:hypothetical protein [Synergistaceae bacterium]
MTFETFLARTAEEDRVFLGGRAFLDAVERVRFAAACCGMANGDGGWIVFGAEYTGRENGKDQFAVEGVADAALLERELRVFLRDEDRISADPVSSFHPVSGRSPSGESKTLLAVKVETADWFLRPVSIGADFSRGAGVFSVFRSVSFPAVYRRVEGNDVLSGFGVRFRMARDALERTRDDRPVPGLSVRDLAIENAVSFRRAVLDRYPHWANLSEVNFLKRALVLDDDEKVTRAGQLLLGAAPEFSGKNSPDPSESKSEKKAESKSENKSENKDAPLRLKRGEQARFAPNLWSACGGILPELLDPLVENCADAVRECFMNALLHADYDAGRVEIELGGDGKEEFIRFSNPGLPRARGAGRTRNYRLLRMFRLAGLVREAPAQRGNFGGKLNERRPDGLEIVRAYDKNFRLRWDTLELFTHAELRLEKARSHEAAEPEIFPPGWLPVVEEEGVAPEDAEEPDAEKPEIEKPEIEEPDDEEAPNGETVPNEETEGAADGEYAKDEEEGEGEYLDEAEDEDEEMGFIPEFASLEELVRSTPRLQASVVREAILELCEDYRSLPELASALARSEISLRRHYISAMVRDGLLEMEFPDKVGHPEQRYRTTDRSEESQKSETQGRSSPRRSPKA